MTTPKRPLHAVPEPGGLSATTFPRGGSTNYQDHLTGPDTTTEEHHDMNGNHDPSATNDMEQPMTSEQRPHRLLGIYNDLFCAVLGLTLDAVAVLAAIVYYRNGVIPNWLDGHGGHWAWLGAGAVVALFVFGEVPDTLTRLAAAWWDLDVHRIEVLRARIAAELAAETDGDAPW